MSLEDIMMSEICQEQKDKYFMISSQMESKKVNLVEGGYGEVGQRLQCYTQEE
jgi:hypothetical protein